MNIKFVQEIIESLPKGRTLFYYFKDRYSLMLLNYFVGCGKTIQEIKKSRFGRLLDKPIVKDILKKTGNAVVTPEFAESQWRLDSECYRLTLGMWGGHSSWDSDYNQTSRTGANLVLQLNFSGKHDQVYEKMFHPRSAHPFVCYGHPIAGRGYHTLSWARIDLDFDHDEALIEEIQNDWIRNALYEKASVEAMKKRSQEEKRRMIRRYNEKFGCDPMNVKEYVANILKPHISIWAEATLAAAIWFLKEEIGINHIFYHTHEFGSRLKRITCSKPPRSLYSDLPGKFCFVKTKQAPGFLYNRRNQRIKSLLKQDGHKFYYLAF